ncbi:MAG TPA: AEC family transporter [Anaerolineae bacterium]
MNELLAILAHDILPIFIVIGLGFAFGRRFKPDVQVLSRLTFFVFSPCLAFRLLVTSNLAGSEIGQIALFTVSVALIMGGLGWITARALRLDARAAASLVLVSMFVNGGNYGLGVNQRAFGDDGLARAIIYFVTSTVMVYTIGTSIAAGSDGAGWRGAARRVLSVPPVYAVIAALLVRAWAIDLTQPALEPILAGIGIAANAAIPAMLAILGMQLALTTVGNHLRPALAASGLRLIVSPFVAWGAASLIGLTGVARQASIVEASMPAAVINIILATEYGAAPGLATSAVTLSTLLSPITLTVILSLLKT